MTSKEALKHIVDNDYNMIITTEPSQLAYNGITKKDMVELVEKDLDKLGELKDIEEEIGIDLITLFKALKNGFYAEHRYIQQYYICFIDGEWAIVNLKNDEWWLLKDYGKTWALDKNELTSEELEK